MTTLSAKSLQVGDLILVQRGTNGPLVFGRVSRPVALFMAAGEPLAEVHTDVCLTMYREDDLLLVVRP